MGSPPSSVLAEILQVAPSLHRSGTFSSVVLEALDRHASQRPVVHSAETGAGASTLLFSHLSLHHTVFALDDGSDSIRAVQASPLLHPGVVTFVEGPTQLTLPRQHFGNKLHLALIDGPHAYPFPDLEYYYLYPHLEEGALLIVDDIHIRSITNLYDFLRADDMFHLEEVVQTTAFFRRTAAPTFSPTGDGWPEQGYNRRDFETLPAEPGESGALRQVAKATKFYLDEIGPVLHPTRRLTIKVPASAPLQVSGWAIDERGQRPAAWVEIVLDGHLYRTDTRVPRGDVAAELGDFRYLRCGFRTTLPPDRLKPGPHTLALRVVFHGGQSFYEGPPVSLMAG